MNPIEQLKNSLNGSNSSFRDEYKCAVDKKEFLISYVKDLVKPHYPTLHFNTKLDNTCIQIDKILYSGDLQERLSKYKEEKEKMIVMLGSISYNTNTKFISDGGNVSIGLVVDNPSDEYDSNGFRVIKNNPRAEENLIAFRTLKSTSVYSSYIFDNIELDTHILAVYGDVHYLIPEISNVKTYTIVYVINDSTIREVTLHDFEKYGNILTKIDLKLE